MKLQNVYGDLLRVKKGIIVHGANAQGAMNAGFAKSLRTKHPEIHTDYRDMYLHLGPKNMLGKTVITQVGVDLFIATGITQEFYGRDPDYQYVNIHAVREVFECVNNFAVDKNLPIFYPMIGAGLGNGDWDAISEIICETISPQIEHTLYIKRENSSTTGYANSRSFFR
jgi:O-acetyl-ADP-ribose deacetylase (regulator of RNase III)